MAGVEWFTHFSVLRIAITISLAALVFAFNSTAQSIPQCNLQPGATADVQINNAIASLPARGGTVDCRGYGATSQTIAATVTIGTMTGTKTVTFLYDRTTIFNCTITNGTPCFQRGPGSSILGFGPVTNPNGGLFFASNARVSAGLFLQDQNGGNDVGGLVDGFTILPNSTMSVTDAVLSMQNPLQLQHIRNLSIGGKLSGILLKIYCTTGIGCGNVEFDHVQIDCQGGSGCKPVWIGCTSPGSTALVPCQVIGNIDFRGSVLTHPGTGGLPIVDIEAGNGEGGANPTGNINFYGTQVESSSSGDIGFLVNGAESFHIYGLFASCSVQCGTDLIRLAQPTGVVLDGVDIRGVDNQGGWTNTLNNSITSDAITYSGNTARLNYTYTKNFSATSSNVWADGDGRQLTVDTNGIAPKPCTFAQLGTPPNGVIRFCTDCNSTCSAGGNSGRMCAREHGSWVGF